jgi:hypothetical protein
MNYLNLENVKVFDINNPNTKIANTKDQIIDMFNDKYVPICLYNDDNKIIGFVKNIQYVDEVGIFYGNIFLYDDKYKDYYLVNYGISGNMENNALVIDAIMNIDFNDKDIN